MKHALSVLATSLLVSLALSIAVPAKAQTLDGTLKKIKETGTITLATRAASVPFNFLDDDNKQAGLAWDISQRVAQQVKKEMKLAKLEVKPLEVTPQTRIPLVANLTVDLECSSTTNNLERQNQVAFSNTFFVVGARLLVRKNSGVRHWADLIGKNVEIGRASCRERVLMPV